MVDDFAGLFDLVHGAIQQFVGADHLQPGAVEGIGERGVDAGQLIAHERARLRKIDAHDSIWGAIRNGTMYIYLASVGLTPEIERHDRQLLGVHTLVRNQLGRIDATLTDALDRTRLQIIRADELLNRTMDKVEETSEVVHKTVISPLRQVNGLMAAISTGVDVFLGQKRRHRKNGAGVQQDEMFI